MGLTDDDWVCKKGQSPFTNLYRAIEEPRLDEGTGPDLRASGTGPRPHGVMVNSDPIN